VDGKVMHPLIWNLTRFHPFWALTLGEQKSITNTTYNKCGQQQVAFLNSAEFMAIYGFDPGPRQPTE